MTLQANARLAGFTYLFYIAVAFPQMTLESTVTKPEGIPAKLLAMAQHAGGLRLAVVLGILAAFSAIVLAVGLFGITRDVDRELSVLALSCRVGEGILGGFGTLGTLALLWLGTAVPAGTLDAAAAATLAPMVLRIGAWTPLIAAAFFAVGSTLFSTLLLRSRRIPVPLAWLGVIGSAVLVAGLPLQLAAVVKGPLTQLMWLPVAAFELVTGPWLLFKGVRVA